MPNEQALGRLSDADNETIFRNDILPDYLPSNLRPVDHPTLIVLGGQPGAGKTALLTSSLTELEKGGSTIRIVGDDLRSYHPGFVTHQQTDAETASRFTQADAGRWTEKLLGAATERRVNVVFETTMRTPENVARIIATSRDAGFRIEARAVAVNERLSWQGAHYRFEEMHRAGEAARIPPRAVHDAAVAGVLASLDLIEREQLADRVTVRLRSGETVYDNSLVDGRWQKPPAAVEAMEQAQNRVLSKEEVDTFSRIWQLVIERMSERNARMDLVDAVQAISRADLAHFATQRRQANEADGQLQDRTIGRAADRTLAPAGILPDGSDPGNDQREREEPQRRNSLDRQRHVHRTDDILVPARELPDLTNAEIGQKLSQSARLDEKRAEIERFSMLVYGSSAAVSATVKVIDNAQSGTAAANDVRDGKLGQLAGEDKRWLRSESSERQAARAHVPQLAAAMEDYGRTVDFERHRIKDQHRDEQQRHRQEVRAPSADLAEALRAPAHVQASRLQGAPALRGELDNLSASIGRRLSADDRSALKAGDVVNLSRSLAVPNDHAVALLRLNAQLRTAQQQLQFQARQQDRALSIDTMVKR